MVKLQLPRRNILNLRIVLTQWILFGVIVSEIQSRTEEYYAHVVPGCPADIPTDVSNIGSEVIENVAIYGDPIKHYYLTLRDLNQGMREHYREYIKAVGRNIFPLIIATDAEPGYFGVGSTYTLYLKDGSTQRIIPVGPNYEMYKALAHMPLALFTIVSPYFNTPHSMGWHGPLKNYQNRVSKAIAALNLIKNTHHRNLTKEIKEKGRAMLNIVNNYIDACFEQKSVALDAYIAFGNELFPYLRDSLETGARIQAFDTLPQLKKWKQKLGDDWKNVYVIIPTVWPVSDSNTREQILKELMDEKQIATHIIKVEGAKDVEDARDTLGRILGDRSLAAMLFGDQTKYRDNLKKGLSSRVDLLTEAADVALNDYFGRPQAASVCKAEIPV